MSWQILNGNCLALMPTLADVSVDAIVTDPPYGLGFMGRAWDDLPPGLPWAQECLRVLKPGGHLLAFGGTRTYHRLTCAIEDAGFEIRDCIAWMYGSGFPKSLDVSKAIDKAASARLPVDPFPFGRPVTLDVSQATPDEIVAAVAEHLPDDEAWRPEPTPLDPDAERWQGWGTALKPAFEPVVVARKPLSGTVAATVLRHGTGAVNVDGCRVASTDDQLAEKYASVQNAGRRENSVYGSDDRDRAGAAPHDAGRWPANVVLDPEAAAMLDAQTGELHAPGSFSRPANYNASSYKAPGDTALQASFTDSGGASRFFYCAKTSSAERNATGKNTHPTVKPIALMQWLVRLVTPPGGLVLDPFAGSGTTGIACTREGFSFVGIEREAEYAAIARARIVADCPLHNHGLEVAA